MKVQKIIASEHMVDKIDYLISVVGKFRKPISLNLQIDEMKILLTILGLLNGCYMILDGVFVMLKGKYIGP